MTVIMYDDLRRRYELMSLVRTSVCKYLYSFAVTHMRLFKNYLHNWVLGAIYRIENVEYFWVQHKFILFRLNQTNLLCWWWFFFVLTLLGSKYFFHYIYFILDVFVLVYGSFFFLILLDNSIMILYRQYTI